MSLWSTCRCEFRNSGSWNKSGGSTAAASAKIHFGLTQEIASQYGFSTDDATQEAAGVAAWFAKNRGGRGGLSGAVQQFDNPGIHVDVTVTTKPVTPGSNRVDSAAAMAHLQLAYSRDSRSRAALMCSRAP